MRRKAARVRKDGTFFWASVVIDPIHEDGKLVGFAKITRDITERREAQLKLEQMQQQLAESQKLEALGQLAGGIAHDFNNMLGVIVASLTSCAASWRAMRTGWISYTSAMDGAERGAAVAPPAGVLAHPALEPDAARRQ